jgi:hypothetical protein
MLNTVAMPRSARRRARRSTLGPWTFCRKAMSMPAAAIRC